MGNLSDELPSRTERDPAGIHTYKSGTEPLRGLGARLPDFFYKKITL